ncbi:MAG: transposase [Candidatus Cloacimonetes bacterium]|nr:transposase [Candidatus Cloacimonadota bacterium]
MKKENQTNVFSSIGRIVAGSYYDMQEIRISTLNRIRDVIRKKAENIGFKEVEKKKKKKTNIEKYTDKQLIEILPKLDYTKEEINYIKRCFDLADESTKLENKYKRAMLEFVNNELIYTEFLKKIKGIGPVLSANLIKEFGYCENYDNVAKLWAHTGNHVVEGIAPKKRKGKDITFSPRLRTLTWKLSDCLMKSNHGIYRDIYDNEKEKQLTIKYKQGELLKKYGKPYKKEDVTLKKLHAHNRALRKMRKLFLAHYWACARELKGLDTREPYVKEKLGHKNIITWKQAIVKEK